MKIEKILFLFIIDLVQLALYSVAAQNGQSSFEVRRGKIRALPNCLSMSCVESYQPERWTVYISRILKHLAGMAFLQTARRMRRYNRPF